MLNKITGALGQVAEAAGTIVGIRHGTEEPPFTVERRVDNVEIRRYGSRIAAETTIDADEEPARNEGFRRLARYIFGGNKSKTKIAMTAPVAQQQSEKIAMTAPVATQRGAAGQWVVRFFMPSEYTLDTLPTPSDDRVRLVNVPAERVAVLQFSGLPSPAAVAAHTDQLLAALRANSIDVQEEPVGWFYDPPWTIPFR
ncbi:MAG: heme-binding protein, partial [Actinomycetota bacterium]|nr:heme-binding protein [Actinomycetota bacterium]